MAAFDFIKTMNRSDGLLTARQINQRFQCDGIAVRLKHSQQGIYKPPAMRYLLSITTRFPPSQKQTWYDDQVEVFSEIADNPASVAYSFMRGGSERAQNQHLRVAWEKRIPLIYFIGVTPNRYIAQVPTFVTDWDPHRELATISFGVMSQHEPEVLYPQGVTERKHTMGLVRQRFQNAMFRQAVLVAYDKRCAFTGLPEPSLIDAVKITADFENQFKMPIVPNGLLLSKTHLAAFDSHLIGVDPDYGIHISPRLLDQHDGPMLEAMKRLQGSKLRLPKRTQDYPDRERLDERFQVFKSMP